jgi:hypothetical protein
MDVVELVREEPWVFGIIYLEMAVWRDTEL